jgi:hypothetical protein
MTATAQALAQQLNQRLAAPVTPRMQQGVVAVVNATTVDLTLGGSAVVTPAVSFLESYQDPTVGDAVWVLCNGPDRLVVGEVGPKHARGRASLTTDGSGNFTIAHGLPTTPTAAFFQVYGFPGAGIAATVIGGTLAATTVGGRLWNLSTHAAAATTAAVIQWRAEL